MPTWRWDAIGTSWSVDTPTDLDASLKAAIRADIDVFDQAWSRFRDDSVVTALSRGQVSAAELVDADRLLRIYAELDGATGGALTPLIGDALAARGYDARLGFIDRGPRISPRCDGVLSWEGNTVRLASPVTLDIGAIGKGRLVDRIAGLVWPHHEWVVVDGSGDIAVRGREERIALEHPYDARRAIGTWTLHEGALCASAVNRRAWGEGLHHVLDGRTGQPVRSIAATWALGADAMTADAAATALFFDSGPALAHRWGIRWVRMHSDGRVDWSPGCTAELFSGAKA